MWRHLLLQDAEGNGFPKKEKLLYALVAGFFTTLYLREMPVINNLVIGLLFLYSFYFNSIKEKLQLLKQRPEVGVMAFFFLLNVISALLSDDVAEGFSWVQIRVPLLLFPVSIGLLWIHERLKDRILFFYCCATVVAAAVCLVWALVVYHRTHDAGYLYNDSLSDAIGKQSIYFAMMINIALFSILYLLFKGSQLVVNKIVTFATMFFLMVIHFLLASRAAIIILYAGLIIFSAYYFFIVRKNSRRLGAGIIVAAGIMITAFVSVFPKTLNRFREMQYTSYQFNSHAVESHYNMQLTPDQWNGTNVRLAIWNCGWELAQRHLLWGVSLGDKHQELLDMYRAKHFDFGVQTNKNMHNNYLDVLCSMGIGALIVFLAGFLIMPLASCYREKDALGLFVIAAFALSMVTETYFDGSLGCVLMCFFLSFILSYKKPAPGY